jgi:putative ABC transport system permease protein
MSMLTLKALRDTLAHKGQFIALIVLVSLGIMSYVTFQNGYYDLRSSVSTAYSSLRFADIDVRVDRIPLSAASRIEMIPGVAAARVRTVEDVGLEMSANRQGTARIVSIPDDGNANVNGVYLESGRLPAADSRDEVMLHPKFAKETSTKVGDTLTLRIGGERRLVHVVGIASDPEYLYPLRSAGDLPSPGEFAILFTTEHVTATLLGKAGSGNDVAVRAAPGTDIDKLGGRLEDDLEPYGVVVSTPRADQPGYDALRSELEQNRVMALWMPILVLAISSMSLFIALSRLVTAQRGEIGLAKALGYKDSQILMHYLSFGLIIATGGSLLGVVLGLVGARGVSASYTGILGLPFLENGLYPDVLLISLGVAFGSCIIAAIMPAMSSARMAPAIAMHSDPNLSLSGGRVPLIERALGPLMPRSFTFRLPLRNIFRVRRRSFYTVLGIAFAMVLSVVTISLFDSIDFLLNRSFSQVERWDIAAVFAEPVGPSRVAEARALRGVDRVQPALVLPVKVLHEGAEANVSLTAMTADADFHGFSSVLGGEPRRALSNGEIVLASSTAKTLGVGVGERVQVDPPPDGDAVSVRVGAISEETLGRPAYVSLETGSRITDEPLNRYNALYLNTDAAQANRIQDDLYDMPGAASVQVKAGLIERLKAMMGMVNIFGWVLLAFGSALAFVVVFTTFTANITERIREIATMRTIGEDNLRLTIMVTLENLLLTVAALPLGIWLGIQATNAIFASISSVSYTLTASIYPSSIAYLCLLMLAVVLLSEAPPVRRIFRLDLAEATKVME